MTVLVSGGQTPAQAPAFVGGKGASLFRLDAAGIAIPATVCVPVSTFQRFMSLAGDGPARLLSGLDPECSDKIAEVSKSIPEILVRTEMPDDLTHDIAEWVAGRSDGMRFAVRSSGLGEDGSATSYYAGQFSTYLNVPALEVIERVKACWCDAFTPGSLIYAARQGAAPGKQPLAVVLQEMVPAERSGVLFTVDPKGDASRMLVSAGYGLGEGVVSGLVNTDLYTLDRFSGRWHAEVAEKDLKRVPVPAGGIAAEKLPAQFRDAAVLNPSHLEALETAAAQLVALGASLHDLSRIIFGALAMAPYLGGARRAMDCVAAFQAGTQLEGQPLAEIDGNRVARGRREIINRPAMDMLEHFARSLGDLGKECFADWTHRANGQSQRAKYLISADCRWIGEQAVEAIGTRAYAAGNPLGQIAEQLRFASLHALANPVIERSAADDVDTSPCAAWTRSR